MGTQRHRVGWVVLFLLVPSLVSADLFDTARQAIRTDVGRADSSGVSVRGGAAITSGVTATSVPLLRGQLTTGGGCGAFSFATSLTQVFEEVPELLEALAQQLANNLPMLVLSYACPTCVDLVKHVQALSNVLVNARFAQCQAMTAAAQYGGMRLRGGEISQCLSDEVAAGHGISAALRTCNGDVTDVRSPTGRRAPRVEVLAETLDAAGASPETRTLAKSLLGELTMSANGGQLGTQQDRPSAGMLARYEANRLAADTALRTAIEELKTTGQVSDATLRAVSVPGQPLPRAALDALVALQQDPTRYETLLGKLSTGLAVTQLTWECDDLKSQLAGSIESNQELTDEQRRLLERRLEALERDLKQVIAKKDIVEKHLQPALDALLQEYQAVQSVATQAGFRAPAKVGPVMPYRTQGPGGYGQ